MTDLSPAAWQVDSAASVAKDHGENPIAAALLAVADQVEHHWDGAEILISDYDAVDIVSWIEPRFKGTEVPMNWTSGQWINREGDAMYPAWWQPLPDHPPLPEEEV